MSVGFFVIVVFALFLLKFLLGLFTKVIEFNLSGSLSRNYSIEKKKKKLKEFGKRCSIYTYAPMHVCAHAKAY